MAGIEARARMIASALICAAAGLFALHSPASARQLPQLLIILDSSSSMEDQLDGKLKYKLVRKAMREILYSWSGKLETGLSTFGSRRKNSCKDVSRVMQLGVLQPQNFLQRLDLITPKGKSPIGAALLKAARQTTSAADPLHMLVIADGSDNCQNNVCATAELIARRSPRTRIHVVGLGKSAPVKRLSCIARATKGIFTPIASLDELNTALGQVLRTVSRQEQLIVKVKRRSLKHSFALLLRPPMPDRRPPRKLAEYNQPDGPQASSADELSTALAKVVKEAGPVHITGSVSNSSPPGSAQKKQAASSRGQRMAQAVPAPARPVPPAGQKAPATGFLGNKPGVEITLPQTSALVKLGALITEEGEQIRNGLVWRIYETKKTDEGRYKLIKSVKAPRFEESLPLGVYLVNLSWGRSHLTEKMDILSSKPFTHNFILNAGGLRLAARHIDGSVLPGRQVIYQIYSDERDQFGKRRLILDRAAPGRTIRLNAGIYHISSLFGTANGTIDTDITVEAGKLTDVVINHTASKVTFKLVNQPGGEALAGAIWRISSPDGKLIKEAGGALPTVILAAGDYTINARYSGRTYARKVTIESGAPVHVEIVIQ